MIARIVLHSSELVAGDIGSANMLEYTVMGETVSVASRLEAANKELGTSILMSDATAAMLGPDHPTRGMGRIDVRGLPEPLEVFTVDSEGAVEQTPPTRPVSQG